MEDDADWTANLEGVVPPPGWTIEVVELEEQEVRSTGGLRGSRLVRLCGRCGVADGKAAAATSMLHIPCPLQDHLPYMMDGGALCAFPVLRDNQGNAWHQVRLMPAQLCAGVPERQPPPPLSVNLIPSRRSCPPPSRAVCVQDVSAGWPALGCHLHHDGYALHGGIWLLIRPHQIDGQ